MNRLICRLFIKDEDTLSLVEKREKYGIMTGIVGIICNLILFGVKFFAGIISGSIAIMAEAVHSLADAVSAIITYVGFKIAAKPGDEEHPFGHQRIEYITGVFLSVFIILAGLELAKMSFEKALHPSPVEISAVIYAIMAVSVVIKLWQAQFCRFAGEKIDSEAIEALAVENRNDVISTAAVIAAMIIYQASGRDVDGITGCIVALFITLSGIFSIRETISPILGEKPDDRLVKQIADLVHSFDEVKGCHDLVIHNYGPEKNFASIHVELDGKRTLAESSELAERIEDRALGELGVIMTVKTDPVSEKTPEAEKIKEIICLAASETEGVKNVHDLRIVEKDGTKEIQFDLVRDGKCSITEEELTEKFRKYLDIYECDGYTLDISIDGAYSVLNN